MIPKKITMTKMDFFQIGILLLTMFIVGKLSYEEGEYDGMKKICGDKGIYMDMGEIVCFGDEEIEELENRKNIGIGGTSPEAMFNFPSFIENGSEE